jgi:hypothetical protein
MKTKKGRRTVKRYEPLIINGFRFNNIIDNTIPKPVVNMFGMSGATPQMLGETKTTVKIVMKDELETNIEWLTNRLEKLEAEIYKYNRSGMEIPNILTLELLELAKFLL